MTTPRTPIRILVVDDHVLVRQGIAALLKMRPGMEVVAEAGDGEAAIELARTLRPDVTLMDVAMPGLDGVETLVRIRQELPDARVVVLTNSDEDDDISRALQAGAYGYLLKDVSADEFVRAIETVHGGRRLVQPELAARVLGRSSGGLTPREMEVLALLARGRSNKEIANDLGIAERTVKQHVNALMAKLNVSSRTQAALTAVKRGLVKLTSI